MTSIPLHDYTIHVGASLPRLATTLQEKAYTQHIVLVDTNTAAHCLPHLNLPEELSPLSVITIPAGEQHKTIDTCQIIWRELMQKQADRSSVLINLGGGVIGDMGGFCASTFKRGIDFIQVPTTLLAQVDASVGGKLGIDFADIKNSIGLFGNPRAVIADPVFFRTLPPRELRSGLAEIIKHSLIADAAQWHTIRTIEQLDTVNWPELVAPSVQIKQRIVAQDPREQGVRKALNFGHTIGHAIESHALYTTAPLLHGEAIAAGMICESYLSVKQAGLPEAALQDISGTISRIYQPRPIAENHFDHLLTLMRNDKKNRHRSEINCSLLPAIGSVEVDQAVAEKEVRESLQFLNTIAKR